MKKAKLLIYILFTIGCAMAIFLFSSQERAVSSGNSLRVLTVIAEFFEKIFNISISKSQILGLHNLFRKTAHFTAYTGLSIFSYNTFRLVIAHKKYAVITSFIFCVLMAVSDEIHQLFVPGRSAEIRDVFIDTLGVCFGLVLVWVTNFVVVKIKGKPKRVSRIS